TYHAQHGTIMARGLFADSLCGLSTRSTQMIRLTNEVIRGAGPGKLWDDKVRGLLIRTYAGGVKSFAFHYRADGGEHLIKIGRWPEWSIEAARDRAKVLRREVDRGGDPAGEKRERREAATVADLVARYIAEHLPAKQSKNRGLGYMAKRVEYRETAERKVL